MSNITFANNAKTILASPISGGATSATLATGTGALFPNPSGSQYFLMTFRDALTGLTNEIVKVTARSGDVVTIVRAQEGTSAAAWLAGDTAANFLTAGSIAALQAGFPTGSTTEGANHTYSGADSGLLVSVTSGGTTQTLPAAATVTGMPIGFEAKAACTIAITPAGGNFFGGLASGVNTISLAIGEFLSVQSNGTDWTIFGASPEIVTDLATKAFVAANYDVLGAAAAVRGILRSTVVFSTSTTLTTPQVGALMLFFGSTPRTLTVPAPSDGQIVPITNLSSAVLTVTTPSGAFTGQGLSGSSFTLGINQTTLLVSDSTVRWNAIFRSEAYDPAGSAATAQTNAIAAANVAAAAAQAAAIAVSLQKSANLADLANINSALNNLGFTGGPGSSSFAVPNSGASPTIIKWGQGTSTGGGVVDTFNFPVAFPNASLIVLAGYIATVVPASGAVGGLNYSAAQYQIQDTAAGAHGFFHISIGF